MFEDFQEEIEQLSKLMISGDASERTSASRRLDEIKGSLGDDAKYVDDLVMNTVADAMENGKQKLSKEQRAVIKGVVSSNNMMGLVAAGAGLAQIIDAAARRKKVTPPQLPPGVERDPILQDQISKAMERAENGDPDVRKYFEENLAEQRAVNTERAKTAGNAGQFRSNAQAAGITETREATKFAADQENRKSQKRGELSRLLSLKQGEDQRIQQDQWKRFGVRNHDYQQSVANLQAQKSSGFQNMFSGLSSLLNPEAMAGAAVLRSTKPQEPKPAETKTDPLEDRKFSGSLSSLFDIRGPQEGIAGTNQGRNEAPTMSLGQLIMMGSKANQTPGNLDRLKQITGQDNDPMNFIDELGRPNFFDF